MSKYTTELPTATLDKAGIAVTAGWLTIFNAEPEELEFIGTSVEYLPVGIGLPALSYVDKPVLPDDGLALVRSQDGTRWESVPDYRGRTAWHTETRQPEQVVRLGELPVTLTLLEPRTAYDKWDGKDWVIDTDAQRAEQVAEAERKKQSLLNDAQLHIATWQTELQLDVISEQDKTSLKAWITYIKSLQAMDPSQADDISWPAAPAA